MLRTRRLLLLSAALLALSAAPALAARPSSAVYGHTLSTAHVVVHHATDPDPPAPPEAITQTEASAVAAMAERAYALETGWGYPAPLGDGVLGGDSKIDIFVLDFDSATSGILGGAVPDVAGMTSSGWIGLDYAQGLTMDTIVHEVFHLVQFGTWIADDSWLLEGTAEWAAFKALGFPTGSGTATGPFDMSLD